MDDFCKELDNFCQNYMLSGPAKINRGPACCIAISEIMTILVMFQNHSKRKNMKEKQELSSHEKQLLNQRGIIETVIGHLSLAYQTSFNY